MWGDSLVRNQYSPRVDVRSDVLYIQITNLISTLCFVLADDLHIHILKFVVGHGTVVQPVSVNIVFGCKQAQQYSRTHHLALSELSAGVHKMLALVAHAYHSYSRTLPCSCIL